MAKESPSSQLGNDTPIKHEADQGSAIVLDPTAGEVIADRDPLPERRQSLNRRDSVWRAFLYGNFRPRRRSSRRAADKHQFIFDWHEPRILYLTLMVLLLSCTDALFTLNLLKAGASEANAVMAVMLKHGMDNFVIGKIVLTSLSLIILAFAARRKFIRSFSVEHVLKIFCGGYLLVICYEIYLFRYVFDLNVIPSF